MNILILGKGGREHALAKIIYESKSCIKAYAWPGNDGIKKYANSLKALSVQEALWEAKKRRVELCIVGDETYLVTEIGIANMCANMGIQCWAPNKKAAQLEANKIYAKEFMQKYNIPTGKYITCETSAEASKHLEQSNFPIVLKFDGLAAGKGVAICHNIKNAKIFAEKILDHQKFGKGKLIIEEFHDGPEISVFTTVHSDIYQIIGWVRDYKKLYNHDKGPNTGGMGSVANHNILTNSTKNKIEKEIIQPTIYNLKKEKIFYKGFLYFGIILSNNSPKLLEYNCRG